MVFSTVASSAGSVASVAFSCACARYVEFGAATGVGAGLCVGQGRFLVVGVAPRDRQFLLGAA
jgi:hypothetical protein